MKITASYGSCKIFVQGMDMDCPMCGVHVPSGSSHECSKPEPKTITASKKRKKKERP